MDFCYVLLVLLGLVLVVNSQNIGEQAIDLSKVDPGKRFNFNLGAAGGGQNARNWQGGVNAGIGAKVWESKNGRASVGVGAAYQRDYARFQGQTYKGKPNRGYGASFTYRFGK